MIRDATRDWTPKRVGDRYCSPGCGGGCTYHAFAMAKQKARALCTMLGPSWKPRVWENLGWFYEATLGLVTVSANYRGGYTACLHIGPNYFMDRKTPKAAVNAIILLLEEQQLARAGVLSYLKAGI